MQDTMEPIAPPLITPKYIRIKLAEYNIKRGDFARLAGISQDTLYRILRGDRSITRGMAFILSEAFKRLQEEQDAIDELETENDNDTERQTESTKDN